MEERFGGLVLSFLGGYAALWFGWAWSRRPWTRWQVARGVLGFGALVMVAILLLQAATCILDPWGCHMGLVPGAPTRIGY